MLATKTDQVEHGWVRTSLGYSSPRGINSDYYINSQYKTHRRKSGPVWGGNTFFFGGGGGREGEGRGGTSTYWLGQVHVCATVKGSTL